MTTEEQQEAVKALWRHVDQRGFHMDATCEEASAIHDLFKSLKLTVPSTVSGVIGQRILEGEDNRRCHRKYGSECDL